ncbi:MAG TPA: protein kinase [Chthoniobacterales bacterium]
MSGETSGNGLDATLREFSGGQKLFGRYTLIKTLGRGGMGVVWLARDEELEREVALKFLPELIVHDRAVLSDLKRETRRSLELTHKNIVRIHDFVHDGQSGCISMEYVDGDTLSNLRADKPRKVFEIPELTDWTSELCDALDYAHNHARIIHRDLKPANLMVNQRGDLKVTDFGIARSLSDSMSKVTMQPGKSGTLVYMSPQQLDGERGTHLDDIYSFGACVYELLTSRPPFSSGNVDRQIREKIPPSMMQRRKELEIEGDRIDESWERVVASCLAKDPARRPQSIAHIADHLALATPKTKTRNVPPLPKTRRQSYSIIAGVAGVLCLLAASIWYFGFHRSAPKPAQMTTVVAEPVRADTSAPAPAPAIPLGGLIITTSPEGATVTLGGKSAGKSPVTLKDLQPGKYPMRIALSGYDTIEKEVEVKGNEFTDLGTLTLQATQSAIELNSVPSGAQVFRGATLLGTTPFRRADLSPGDAKFVLMLEGYLPSELRASLSLKDTFRRRVLLYKPASLYKGTIDPSSGQGRPLTIKLNSDGRSGTMTQTGKRGDVVVKFNGVWEFGGTQEGITLRAVTDEVISIAAGIEWSPEFFYLRFTSDGSSATYESNAGGKTYIAKLTGQTISAANPPAVYKGTIRTTDDKAGPGVPLTIKLEADRKSGTMTYGSKSGDTVVKFNGVLDGTILHAVTDEVISKPAKVKWEPESFTIRFNDDGIAGTYEYKAAGGKIYVATLTP